jgi:Rrf2 family protein
MFIPHKKSQYALRAIYELAKRKNAGPTKISKIAAAQGIPRRFLEVILNQLKSSGIVASKRGFYGGYFLTKSAEKVSVGDVLRFLEKKQGPPNASPAFPRRPVRSLTNALFQFFGKTSRRRLLIYMTTPQCRICSMPTRGPAWGSRC